MNEHIIIVIYTVHAYSNVNDSQYNKNTYTNMVI